MTRKLEIPTRAPFLKGDVVSPEWVGFFRDLSTMIRNILVASPVAGDDGKVLYYDHTNQKFDYRNIVVDRGDPSDFDWTLTDFTTDGTWRDLDCSSIVPSGARFIIFYFEIKDDAAGSAFHLRENGISNDYNLAAVETQVANVLIRAPNMIVACDSNRIVEYLASNVTFTTIQGYVRGWIF